MKYLVPLLVLATTGCQSKPIAPPLPRGAVDPRPIAAAPMAATRATANRDTDLRRQTQLIQALVNENDALKAKLETVKASLARPPVVTPKPSPLPKPKPAPAPAGTVPARPAPTPIDTDRMLTPDADGVIDLRAAIAAAAKGEPVNPFAIRVGSSGHEISIRVEGVIEGGTAGAVINDEVLETGEAIDQLTVERIEPDGVILRQGDEWLRIPVGEKPTKVRLAL